MGITIIGSGGGGGAYDQSLNTTDDVEFNSVSLPNTTQITVGSFDNMTGGANGISLHCAVGYELNWQGGRLRSVQTGDTDATPQTISCDSPLEFPGEGVANLTVDSDGITFPDGTTLTTAPAGAQEIEFVPSDSGAALLPPSLASGEAGKLYITPEYRLFFWNGTGWYPAYAAPFNESLGSFSASAITSGTLGVARLPNVLEKQVTGGSTGSSVTLSLANGSVQTWTLSAACTFTMPAAEAGASLTILLTQGGTFTATFTGVLWPDGAAPTITATANKRDVLVFVSDGTNWFGTASQNY